MSEIQAGRSADDRGTESRVRFRSVGLGSVLLFLGIAVLSLLVADRVFGLPVNLPRSWYTDRGLWVAIGLVSFGCRLVFARRSETDPGQDHGQANRETRHNGVRFDQDRALLHARAAICAIWLARRSEKHRDSLPPPIEVDIDTDPALLRRVSRHASPWSRSTVRFVSAAASTKCCSGG